MPSCLSALVYLYICIWNFNVTPSTGTSGTAANVSSWNEALLNRGTVIDNQHVLMNALKQMIEYMEWTSLTVIFDDTAEMFVTGLSEYVQKGELFHYRLLRVRSDIQHFQSRLLDFYLSEESHFKNFLVVCGAETLIQVMKTANSVDDISNRRTYMRHHSRWLLVTSKHALPTLSRTATHLDHVATMTVNHENIPDISGQGIGSANITNLEHEEIIPHTTDLGIDTEFHVQTLLWLPGRRDWTALGYVCHDVALLQGEVFPNIRRRFNGRQFIVTILEWPGFVMKTKSGSNVTYSGFCLDLLEDIAQKLNFTYRLVAPPDGKYGSLKDGRWTGIIGQLVRREVDFTAAAVSVNAVRDLVIDYISTPLHYDFKDIVYRKLGSETKWRLLLDVFDPMVLLCLIGVVFLTSFLLLAIETVSYTSHTRRKKLSIFTASFWYIFGSVFHQGGSTPTASSARVLVACMWMVSVIMAATYSANLIAHLAVPKHDKPFSSLKELLQSKDYTWGVNGGGSTQSMISTSVDPDIQTLWRAIVEFNKTDTSVLSGNTDEQFRKVLNENYAMIYGHERQGPHVECHVDYLGVNLLVYSKGFAVPAESPLKAALDEIMFNVFENGILGRLSNKWLLSNSSCDSSSPESAQVGLSDLQSAFYVLMIGLGGATLTMIFEYFTRRGQNIYLTTKHK